MAPRQRPRPPRIYDTVDFIHRLDRTMFDEAAQVEDWQALEIQALIELNSPRDED
jgi:hypothetical protein